MSEFHIGQCTVTFSGVKFEAFDAMLKYSPLTALAYAARCARVAFPTRDDVARHPILLAKEN